MTSKALPALSHYTRQHEYLQCLLNSGTEEGLLPGVQQAIMKMNDGEKAHVWIKPGRWGFGTAGKPDLDIPGDAVIEYIIHLKKFENVSTIYIVIYYFFIISYFLFYCFVIHLNDTTEKCFFISWNCSEKLGDTWVFCCIFAIELLLHNQFLTSVQE